MNETVQTEGLPADKPDDIVNDEAVKTPDVDPVSSDVEEKVDDNAVVENEVKQSKSKNAKQRLRRKNRALEEENARLKAIADDVALVKQQLHEVKNPPPARPQRVDYETEEDYEDSLFEWRGSKTDIVAEKEPVQEISHDQKPAFQVNDDIQDNWFDQKDLMSEKYDDYDDILASIPGKSMTEPMTLSIMESKNAGEISYFLGNNHAEAQRISKLSFAKQVSEIEKLSDKFTQKITNAPDPISPISHNGDTTTTKKDPLLEGATFE